MANAAVLINNLALAAGVGLEVSDELTTMPSSNLLTPHIAERWRTSTNSGFMVLDKGDLTVADTFVLSGVTATTVRIRLSTVDSAAGDVADETFADGDSNFDSLYGTAVLLLSSAAAWRYARVDLSHPSGSYVEAGLITVGEREEFEHNFMPGSSVQWIDRSRVTETAAGLKLVWTQNRYRRVDLNFEWVTLQQRYGLIEIMDLVNGRHLNVLLIIDTESDNLSRDSIIGLVSDISPNTWLPAVDLFGKQFRLEERI